MFGKSVKLVNLVLHDLGSNGFWAGAEGSEIYGCIIYHNGFDAADRGHGHGIYAQNATGTKTIAENIVFGGYSFGIHVYTEGGSIQGFDLVGNVLFNAGVVSSVSGHKDDCLIGGLQPADRILLRENLVWAIGGDTRSVQLGYSVANGAVQLQDNYVIGALTFAQPWSSITMTGNTLCTVTGVDPADYPSNTYLTVDPLDAPGVRAAQPVRAGTSQRGGLQLDARRDGGGGSRRPSWGRGPATSCATRRTSSRRRCSPAPTPAGRWQCP